MIVKSKYFSLTLLILVVHIKSFAQQPIPDSQTVVILNPEIGEVIDADEKLKYSLFPYFSTSTFAYAKVYSQINDSTNQEEFFVIARMKDSSIQKRSISDIEMNNLTWLVNKNEINKQKKKLEKQGKQKKWMEGDTVFHKLNKNAIYATLGPVPLLNSIGVTYERQLFQRNKRYLRSIGVKLSGGAWLSWESGGPYGSIAANALWGPKANHLETMIGAALLSDRMYGGTSSFPLPVFAIGYRFQYPDPDEHFVFRTGLGFPEALYFSFGISF